MKKTSFIIILAAIINTIPVYSQEYRTTNLMQSALRGWEYSIKAGFNIGGTSPIPLPQEIRTLDKYQPGLSISIEGNATKWLDSNKKWGMTLGIRFENKSMNTNATTKNYGMEIVTPESGKLKGLWTGGVHTEVKNSYITVPILANYAIGKRWKVVAGPYFSYMMEGNFSGHIYDGHLRTPDAHGSKVNFSGESKPTYDFSEEMRNFQWGIQVGGEWKAYKHLTVHADLTWGLNDIFNKNFKTISFSMYPIYLNLGFGYRF